MKCCNEIERSQKSDEVEKGESCERGEDPWNLVRLRTGNNKVELNADMSYGEYAEREIIHTDRQSAICMKKDIRAVETRSYAKQDAVSESQTTGGESRQDPVSTTISPTKVILSSYTNEDLAIKQKEDPDISFVYESLLKGRKRPSSSDVVTEKLSCTTLLGNMEFTQFGQWASC